MLSALMLSGHVSVLAWGAKCGAVLAVVWSCECELLCWVLMPAWGVNCLHVL